LQNKAFPGFRKSGRGEDPNPTSQTFFFLCQPVSKKMYKLSTKESSKQDTADMTAAFLSINNHQANGPNNI
jgi:hypothetical protein